MGDLHCEDIRTSKRLERIMREKHRTYTRQALLLRLATSTSTRTHHEKTCPSRVEIRSYRAHSLDADHKDEDDGDELGEMYI